VLPEGVVPELARVQHTDGAEIGVFEDRLTGGTIVICTLDNLGKGAAGQAVPERHLLFGYEETAGLRLSGVLALNEAFACALRDVCADLARQIVEDGEGATVLLEFSGWLCSWNGGFAHLQAELLTVKFDGTFVFERGTSTRLAPELTGASVTIRSSHDGRGLATESSAALTRVAFDLCDVDRIEIRIDRANDASLTIPRKLGFAEEGMLRRRLPPDEDGVPRDVIVFSLFRDVFASSPASSAPVQAFDAGGERML